jgi:hypothetical protein
MNGKPKCVDCKKTLTHYSRKTKRCWNCSVIWRKRKNHHGWLGGKITVICKNCKEPFDTYPSKIKIGRGKYCGRKCHGIAMSKNNVGKSNPRYKKGKPHCIDCGTPLTTYGHKRCQKCWGKWHRGKNHSCWQGGWKNKLPKCIDCGKQVKGFNAKRCPECGAKENGKLHSKQNHPNWQGGKSFEPYSPEFTQVLRRIIRNRDGHKCQLCGVPEIECVKALHVHHIDYNKKHSHPSKLISLCGSCNIKVNVNRKKWEKYFKNLIKEKYGDLYGLNKIQKGGMIYD